MIYLDNATRPWKETYNLPEVKAIRDKIKDSFKDLVFDEGPHQYYLNGKNVRSVSKTIDLFVVPFDSWGQAQSCYEKYYEDPTSPYYHMTAKEIKKSWDDNNRNANDQGTLAHAFGENAMHYMVGDYDAMDPMFRERIVDGKYYAKDGFEEAIVKFWNDLPDEYVPVMVESRVYATCGTDNPVYAGTFDELHNARNKDVGSVANAVDFHLFAAYILIDENRLVGVDFDRRAQIAPQVFFRCDDLHGASAEYEARTHKDREPDLLRRGDSLVDARNGASFRLGNIQLGEQLLEFVAVFRAVDGVDARANDLDAAIVKRLRKVDGRLTA